jgi:hypothetical protein
MKGSGLGLILWLEGLRSELEVVGVPVEIYNLWSSPEIARLIE